MNKLLNDIKLGLLTDHELSWLLNHIEMEKDKRNLKPEEYVEAIYADDGSEGFYCLKENFHKIPSDQLHGHIAQTLAEGSSITFTMDKYEKKEYAESCARYEWRLSDGTNTEVKEEDDDEEDSDLIAKYGR